MINLEPTPSFRQTEFPVHGTKGPIRPDNGMRWSDGQGFSEDEPNLNHKKEGGGG